jgi:serine/threonine protein phosphatase PrpC
LDEEDLNRINTLMDIINPDNLEDVLISDYVGSSGIIILLTGNITYIANAGNSHFIIINKNFEINNKIIEKQKNYEEEEKNRIKIIKGLKYGKNIINEEYSYTRGFGDYQYKTNDFIKIDSQEILAEPFIYEINQSDIKYIIIFNNGFYENFQNMNMSEKDIDNKEIIYKNIADYFLQYLKDDQKAISEIISDYFNKYIPNNLNQINDNNKNSQVNSNNLSCIIVDFFT